MFCASYVFLHNLYQLDEKKLNQQQNYADNPTIPFGSRTNEDHDQGIVNLAYVELEQQNSVLLAWLHFHLLIHFFPVLLGVFILDCWVYSFLTSLGGDP